MLLIKHLKKKVFSVSSYEKYLANASQQEGRKDDKPGKDPSTRVVEITKIFSTLKKKDG